MLCLLPQRGSQATRRTKTMLFSVPLHLEWKVSEHKFSVSLLALTPQHVLQVETFTSGSNLLEYGWYEIKDSDCTETHSWDTASSSHQTNELWHWHQW